MSFNLADPCLWCVGGSSPHGIYEVLGPVFKLCRACLPLCPTCEGEGLFPSDFDCLPCFRNSMAALGLSPLFCVTCAGVIELVDSGTKPEVVPHVDH